MGWSIGVGDTIKLTKESAAIMSVGTYLGLVVGVLALSVLIHELAKAFDSTPTYTQSLELAAYTATPLFMVGFAAFYPVLWFVMMIGLGLTYSVYVLLTILMAASIILWSMGMGPVFTG